MARGAALSTARRFEGVLAAWDDRRGFGFIEPVHGGDPIFVHVKAFASRGPRPAVGEPVRFEVEPGANGKKRARSVVRVRVLPVSRRRRAASGRVSRTAVTAASAFTALLAIVAVTRHVPAWVLPLYAATSVACALAYVVDKSAAVDGRRRVPEQTLILLGLAGGWPGAVVAQQWLRHKTTKTSFRTMFWSSVALNVAGFAALATMAR